MITIARVLDNEIKEVCPIIGVSIGVEGDPSTYKVHFDPSATLSQQTAALAIAESFVLTSALIKKYNDIDTLARFNSDPVMQVVLQQAQVTNPSVTMETLVNPSLTTIDTIINNTTT